MAGNNGPGRFILSLDTELAWGSFDNGGLERNRGFYQNTRQEIRRLLDLLDRYQLRATWAFVGHLLLDRCERTNGTTHEHVLRPKHSWYPADWHACDPGTDIHRDPLWYGTDILEDVRGAKMQHEVACHTFSHIIVGDSACTGEIALSQFEECRRLHARHGLPLHSVVFPRNQIGHLDVLRRLGITAYRGRERNWYSGYRGLPARLAHLASRAFAVTPPTYAVSELAEDGLANLPASMFLLPGNGLRKLIPMACRRCQAFKGLQRASERGELFHLWLHPFNLASDPGIPKVMEDILRSASRLQEEGKLVSVTMAELAAQVLNHDESEHHRYRLAGASL